MIKNHVYNLKIVADLDEFDKRLKKNILTNSYSNFKKIDKNQEIK